jgi:DNA topoisomerase-1
MRNKTLIPTFTAFAVVGLLENHFPDLVDPKFTSKMEETLDDIATGSAQWLPYLDRFYRGEKGLESQVKERESQINSSTAKSVILEDLQATIKIGKYDPIWKSEG